MSKDTMAKIELVSDSAAMPLGVNVLYGQPLTSSNLRLHAISLESMIFANPVVRSPIFPPDTCIEPMFVCIIGRTKVLVNAKTNICL